MSEEVKIAVRFGVYGGILAFIVALIILLSGKSPLGDAGWMGIWVPVVSIWFADVQIKKLNNNYLSFKNAFAYGTITLIVYALLYEILFYIFSIFNSVALEYYIDETIRKFEEVPDILGGKDSELYNQMITQTQNLTLEQAVSSEFILKIVGGLFLVLAISNFVRSRNKPENNENQETEEVSIIDDNE